LVVYKTHSRKFILKCRREHIREKLERNRKKEFHERHNDEDSEWYKSQYVLRCTPQLKSRATSIELINSVTLGEQASYLPSLSTSQHLSVQNLPLQSSRYPNLREQQLRSMPIMRRLMLYFFPDSGHERTFARFLGRWTWFDIRQSHRIGGKGRWTRFTGGCRSRSFGTLETVRGKTNGRPGVSDSVPEDKG
jgi:hypothetical protein